VVGDIGKGGKDGGQTFLGLTGVFVPARLYGKINK
jgi:hypothetical protein